MTDFDDDIARELLPLFYDKARSQVLEVNRALMILEQPELPDSIRADVTDEMMRVLHTIKGDSGSVGLPRISSLTHDLESSLKAHRAESGLPAGGEIYGRWFALLDLISEMVEKKDEQAVDEDRVQQVTRALTGQMDADPAPAAPPQEKKKKSPRKGAAPKAAPEPKPGPAAEADKSSSPSVEGRAAPAASRDEVVRISTRKLDRLAEGMSGLMSQRILQEEEIKRLQDQLAELFGDYRRERKSHQSLRDLIERTCRESGAGEEASQEIRDSLREREREREQKKLSGHALLSRMQRLQKDVRQAGSFMRTQEEELRRLRMTPVADLFNSFHRFMRDASIELGKAVDFNTAGESVELDRSIVEQLREPLIHLLRNSLDHGLEGPHERKRAGKAERGRITLSAFAGGGGVVIEVSDDGRGLDTEAIKDLAMKRGLITEHDGGTMTDRQLQSLAFASGFSTRGEVSMLSGRGVGLDAVRSWVDNLRGRLEWDSRPGQGLLFRMSLPLTMATIQALIVRAGAQKFALPLSSVDRVMRVKKKDLKSVEARASIIHEGQPVELCLLSDLLGIKAGIGREQEEFPVALSWGSRGILGLVVEDLLGEQEIVMKNFTRFLKKVPNLAGASIVGSGDVVLVLNAADLHLSAAKARGQSSIERGLFQADRSRTRKQVLVTDDSLITRTMESRILVKAGYEVIEAQDGLQAFAILKDKKFDLLVSDVQMPRMDGLELTRRVRSTARLAELPIIIVSFKDNEEDRLEGMEAGANAYLTKSQFSQNKFLEIVEQLIGEGP